MHNEMGRRSFIISSFSHLEMRTILVFSKTPGKASSSSHLLQAKETFTPQRYQNCLKNHGLRPLKPRIYLSLLKNDLSKLVINK